MKTYGLTDKGKEREYNEDTIGMHSYACGITVLAVCDGMGGALGGKIAADLAKETFFSVIEENINALGKVQKADGARILREAVEKANRAVFARSRESDEMHGMGCTLCALMLFEKQKQLLSVNVGDSRLYKITKKKISRLTRDHSYVQYLLDLGKITPDEAENHPQKNLITRAVGIEPEVEADIKSIHVPRFGHTYFMLCSDGLYTMVYDEDMKDIILSLGTLEEKAERLKDEANAAGGYDNISLVFLSLNEKRKGADR